MNTYYGQYIRNRYPTYSRIRNDDNSNGGKIFDTLGNYFQIQLNEIKKRNFNNRCIENLPILEPEAYYEIQLNQNSEFQTWISSSENEINNIYIEGNRNQNTIVLNRADNLNSFLEISPSTIGILEKEDTLDFEDNVLFILDKDEKKYDGSFYLGEKGRHIYLEIPKEWINENNKFERLIYNSFETSPNFQYNYFITIRGVDIADKEIEETIYLSLDTIYRSKTKFKYLKSLIPDNTKKIKGSFLLEKFGFSAPVIVKIYNNERKEFLRYEMMDLVLNKKIEKDISNIWSDCFFNLSHEENETFLNYNFCLFNENQLPVFNNYDFYNEITFSDIQNKSFVTLIKQQLLLPIGFTEGEIIEDFTIDFQRNKIIAITNLLKVIYYDIGKNTFENPSFGRTKQISLEFENENQHVKYKEEKELHLFNNNFDLVINNICIFRKTPFANNNQIEFLNGSYEWQFTPFYFNKKLFYSNDIVKQQFADLDFVNKIKIPVVFNIPGQWDFYVLSFNDNNIDLKNLLSQFSFDGNDLNLYLKNKAIENLTNPINDFELNYKSYYVENNLPIKTFDLQNEFNTLLDDQIDINNISINLEMNTNNSLLFIYINDLTNEKLHVYKTNFHSDVFFYDNSRKTIFTQEDYDNLMININDGSLNFAILRDE